ncbi:MAG: SusC/RagA family TonB-linked outer membrane protein, partial [Pricia sp.]
MKNQIKPYNANRLLKAGLFCLVMISFTTALGAVCEQNNMVTASFEDVELRKVFERISQSNGYNFFYEASEIDVSKKVTISTINVCLDDFLQELCSANHWKYEIIGNQIVVALTETPMPTPNEIKTVTKDKQFQTTISGSVEDNEGLPLPGASIAVKGTTSGTITDFDGNFELTLPSDATVLVVSYIGFESKEVEIGSVTTFNITLEPDNAQLDEVVVVGYGTLAKKRVTGSVISVTPEAITEVPSLSPESAIIGRVAGVQVQETSGEPGASPNIRVRGSGSISAGNDPLFVIDGVPISRNLTSTGTSGGLVQRGAAFQPPPVNPLATLNPNDIESIQVLKDASAAAIYGSRGGNGVLLITTKRGSPTEDGKFSFDSFLSIQDVANKIDLMNAEQLIDFTTDARNNNYLSSVPGASIDDPIGPDARGNVNFELPESYINWDGTDTDWQDAIFKTGLVKNYNFSYASPVRNNTSFFASAGYFNQTGIVDRAQFERYNLMLNLNSQLTEKLNLDLRVAPTITENQRVPASAPYFARPPGVIYSALVHSPTVQPFNPDGTINQRNNQSFLGGGTTTASNPLAIIEGVDDQIFQFQTRASLGLSYEILPKLTFKTFGGTYINLYNQDFYRANTLLFREANEGESYAQATSSTEVNWLWENTLNWEKEFGDHFVNALIGYTAQRDNVAIKQVLADNFPDDLVTTISGGQVYAGTSVKEQWTLASALFRLNYSFQDKYLLTGTIRSDRSSRFGSDNQTGYFPSFSVGWRVNEEDFLQEVEAISELKLR